MEEGNKLNLSKIKLLYIFNELNALVTNNELTSLVLDGDFLEYFSLQQVLEDLYNTKLIDIHIKNGMEYYYITDDGINILKEFTNNLPEYFKNSVDIKFKGMKKEQKKKEELFAHFYKKNENEYVVSFQVLENKTSILSLSINVPTEKMAKFICEKWNKSPDKMFADIYKILTSDL